MVAPAPERPPLLVFDGDCAFCTSCATWIARRWPEGEGAARAVTAQGLGAAGLAGLGLTPAQAAAAAWWIDPDGRCWRGHMALARSLEAAGGMWGILGRLLHFVPARWVGAGVYRLVARTRHRLPGGTPACRRPPAPAERPGGRV